MKMKNKNFFSKVFVLFIFLSMNLPAALSDLDIKGLFSGTDQKKMEIIGKIKKTGNKVYLPELAQVLEKEKKDEIRSSASLALLEAGDSTCIPYYRKAVGDTYWQVRLYGIQGLVRYGEGSLVPDFRKAMKDTYWQVRYYSAIGLGKYSDEKEIPFLVSSLNEKNEDVKGEILWALAGLMWKDISRHVFRNLPDNQVKNVLDAAGSGNPEIRIRTLWLLDAVGDRRAIPVFVKLLEDGNDEIKIRALWAIERLKAEDGNRQIEGLLAEESTQVKIESIRTLVRLKASESINGLVTGLSDPDDRVRGYSLWALEKFREPLSYPHIVEKLADESPQIREYAEKLVAAIDDPTMDTVLQNFIEDESFSKDSRITALNLLGKRKNKDLLGFILGKTMDGDPRVRYAAVNSAFAVSRFDPDVLKSLAYLENKDSSRRVRNLSSSLMRQAMKELLRILENPAREERQFVLDRMDNMYGSGNLPDMLVKMSYSKYPEVREKMLLMAREMPSRVYGKNLVDMMKEADMNIKKLAAFAVGETRYRAAIPLLRSGTRHFDPEYQLICAWALSRMKMDEAFPLGARYLQSGNVEYQKLAAEIFVNLNDKRASGLLLKSLLDSELEVKLISSWALARMGEEKGLETLVRLSEESVEPVRTQANKHLEDPVIPASLRRRVPSLRETLKFEKLGILEIQPKKLVASLVKSPISIDGSDRDRFWQTATRESLFILLGEEKIPSSVQTKVSAGYDKNNIYFLFICDDPNAESLTLNSRDFITVSVNPGGSERRWYQFVVHPKGDIRYSYVWKLYESSDEPDSKWEADWKSSVRIEKSRWIVEMAIPLSNFRVNVINPGETWAINFQRDSQQVPATSWTGRIDNPEQFGVINFKE